MKIKCYRCGTCCHDVYATVPKDISSDLSPNFLKALEEKEGREAVIDYFDNNGVLPMGRCYWLKDEPDGTTTCLAHDRRGDDCRNYPDPTLSKICKVGKMKTEGKY